MKAIVAHPPKKNSVNLVEIPEPIPEKNQVLLKILCVGVDGTDRDINEGVYGIPPEGSRYLVLGHESLARVEEIGDRVKGFSKGDLVVPTVRRPCPENCLNCRNGETDKCLTGNYFEHGIYRLDGFASEYAVSDANFLIKVPEELEAIAVLLEPLSVAENAVSNIFKIQERMVWKPGKVLVSGAGPLGLLAVLILRLRGFEIYAAATREKESLKAKIVSSAGGTYINVRETPLEKFKEKFDIIFEATGSVHAAIEAISLLGKNGVIAFLGIYRERKACEELGRVLTTMVLENQIMFGSVSSNKTHFEMGVKDMLEIRRRYGNVLERLVTGRLYPSDFKKAFEPDKAEIKTVIYFK